MSPSLSSPEQIRAPFIAPLSSAMRGTATERQVLADTAVHSLLWLVVAKVIGVLIAAVSRVTPLEVAPSGAPILALISWALVHGLVVLTRDGALPATAGTTDGNGADLAHQLAHRFAEYIGENL